MTLLLKRRAFLVAGLSTLLSPLVLPANANSLSPYSPYAEPGPTLYGDGVHEDTEALQALFDGKAVYDAQGNRLLNNQEFQGKTFVVTRLLEVDLSKISHRLSFVDSRFHYFIGDINSNLMEMKGKSTTGMLTMQRVTFINRGSQTSGVSFVGEANGKRS